MGKRRSEMKRTSLGTMEDAMGTIALYLCLVRSFRQPISAVRCGLFGVLSIARAFRGRKKRMTVELSAEKATGNIECCHSPLPSISHVTMTAPGMGSSLGMSTRPSTPMYSPSPFDAIDYPSGIVDIAGHERRTLKLKEGEGMRRR